MKFKVDEKLIGLKKEPIEVPTGEKDKNNQDITKPIEIGDVIIAASLQPIKGDDEMTADTKVELFKISTRISDAQLNGKKDVELNNKELTLVLERIGKQQPPLVTGAAFAILDK